MGDRKPKKTSSGSGDAYKEKLAKQAAKLLEAAPKEAPKKKDKK